MIALTMIAPTTTAAFILNSIPLNAIAKTSAVQIVDCLIEGALIAIFAGIVLRAPRLQNSSTKFAVWFSALMGIATLPALAGVLSSIAWAHAASISAPALSHSAITLPGSWALYIFAAWAAIAGWFLLGVARGLWHLYVLRKSCVRVDSAGLDVRLRETLARTRSTRTGSPHTGSPHNRSPRPVELCTSDRVQVPTAIGLVKPAVILPSWLMQELSPEELHQILLHELAHLRRWDDWTNLAQKLVKALFFFHPAVWWIEPQVSLEREMACDDAVVAETASPRAYAECLAHLAEKTLVRSSLIQRSVVLAQAALGRIRHTSLRVAQILNPNRPTGAGRSWKPAVSFMAAFVIASVAWISRSPRLIAFQDDSAPSIVSPTVAGISSAPGNAIASEVIPASELSVRRMLPERPVHVVQAGLNVRANHRGFETSKSAVALRSHASDPITTSPPQMGPDEASAAQPSLAQTYFRLPNAGVTPVAFTETFFVVLERPGQGSSDQPVFQIQWWRVLVLHPAIDPNSNRIPPKKT